MNRPSIHPVVRCALWFCPSNFRNGYGWAIAIDARERKLSPFAVCIDLICQGTLIRTDSVSRDVTFGIRTLVSSPLYTLVVLMTIAVAIAVNVAVGSVLLNILLRPLPYANANRLVSISSGAFGLANAPFSYLDAQDVGLQTKTSFKAFGISSYTTASITSVAQPRAIEGSDVTPGYFEVLGARAQIGRLFSSVDVAKRNVIISDRIWRRYFDASVSIQGHTLALNGLNYTIIGVMDGRFRDIAPSGQSERDYWLPIDPLTSVNQFRGTLNYNVWGLLRRGVPRARAQLLVGGAVSNLVHRYPLEHPEWGKPLLRSALDIIVSPVRPMVWLLYGVVLLLLVIACTNIANLSLARTTARTAEFAIREAVGASRARVAAQLGWEMGLLSLAGGIAGVALGSLALKIFGAIAGRLIPRWESVGIDGTVISYVAGVLIVTTVVSGVIPFLCSFGGKKATLKGGSRVGQGQIPKGLSSALVIFEIAFVLALVLPAGLLVRSFVALVSVPVGFDASNLYVVVAPDLSTSRYRGYFKEQRIISRIARQFNAIPGVLSSAITSSPPFEVEENTFTTFSDARLREPVDLNVVSSGYFETMRIPLLNGRDFDNNDRFASRQVAIVSATFARQFFGTLNVIGRTYHPHVGWRNQEIRTIVGVARDTRFGFRAPYVPLQYLVTSQVPGIFGYFVVRTRNSQVALAEAIARAYTTVDPKLPEPLVESYSQLFAQYTTTARLAAVLFGAFALVALLLGLVGVYSVTAYSVERRTQEFAIRKAVGASDGRLFAEVLGATFGVTAIAVGIGLALAALNARILAVLLFQTSPFDLLTLANAVGLVFMLTLIAALVPALRASRIQPAVALGYE